MNMKFLSLKDLLLIVPASLALAGLLALLQNRTLAGGPGFFVLLLAGLTGLMAAWRWAGAGKSLAWMAGLALALRLAAGTATYLALPVDGYDEPDDRAGYVFTDAHRRDDQAWELAGSGKPILSAFDKSFYTDQYGGLLALSALTYRYLSPDAHRPLLIVLLAALTASLGVPFLFRSARLLGGDQLAAAAGWFFVLYPESVLTGGAQMREPFLLTFSAMALWGFAAWLENRERRAWAWLASGLAGLLLISPAMALMALLILGGWLWLRGEDRRVPWGAWAALGAVFVLGVLLLAWSVNRQQDFGTGSPVGLILNWMRASVKWVIYQLAQSSGQIQNVFSKLNPLAQFLFVIGYGIVQPVLPAALAEPTTLTWRLIAVLRSAGWYVLLPILFYSLFLPRRMPAGRQRRLWMWLAIACWLWIIVCAIRAGGDQWDNPRYRLILFVWQALVAGNVWTWARAQRDPWLGRILVLELICVLLFSQWYLSRYYMIGTHFPFLLMLSLALGAFVVTLLGGWLLDRRRAGQRLTHPPESL
jgi:hypothetical protein